MLGIPIKSILHDSVLHYELTRDHGLRHGQAAALRAPANRSQLNVVEQDVMRAIGAKIWNDARAKPVEYDVWESDDAFLSYSWARAMRNMQAFYQQATRRKGIKL